MTKFGISRAALVGKVVAVLIFLLLAAFSGWMLIAVAARPEAGSDLIRAIMVGLSATSLVVSLAFAIGLPIKVLLDASRSSIGGARYNPVAKAYHRTVHGRSTLKGYKKEIRDVV